MVMSFPYILLVLVAAAIFEPGMWTMIIILGLVDWPGVARLVRGNVLSPVSYTHLDVYKRQQQLRLEPRSSGKAIEPIQAGTGMTVLGVCGPWYHVLDENCLLYTSRCV